tara:strand:+ start:300 stop:470 length:171 start_codon:yes stop_codon:yes gene_type:complete
MVVMEVVVAGLHQLLIQHQPLLALVSQGKVLREVLFLLVKILLPVAVVALLLLEVA